MTQRIDKLWGHEQIIVNNDLYCGKILTVLPNGNACSIHFHKLKTETFHLLSGRLFIQIGPYSPSTKRYELRQQWLLPGESLTIKPYTAHRFWSEGVESQFIEFSTPDSPKDSYRIIESGPKPVLGSLFGIWDGG